MKLRGEFVIRKIVDEIIAIPVGDIALEFNGIIMLNNVSIIIWENLEKGTDIASLVNIITEQFEVTSQEAEKDIIDFLNGLKKINLIEE